MSENSKKRPVTVLPYVRQDGRQQIVRLLMKWVISSYQELEDPRRMICHIDKLLYGKEEADLWESLLGGRETVNKRGKIAKRLRSNVKRELGYKLTPQQMSEIGNIAANYSTASGSFLYEDTDVMDMGWTDFGNEGSCFFLEYGSGHNFHHRIAMERDPDERFRLVKVYNKDDEPIARAFVYTNEEDGAQLIFNAYGSLTRIKIASIIATDLDLGISRKVQFSSDVYINDDRASAISGDKDRESYHVNIDVGAYTQYIDEYDENYTSCERCGSSLDTEYGEYRYDEDNDDYYCEDCWHQVFRYCHDCDREHYYPDTTFYEVPGSSDVCEYCYRENYAECQECGDIGRTDEMDKINGAILCDNCQSSSTGYCALCEEHYYPQANTDREYCESCTNSLKQELLRASQSNCPTCYTADGRPFNNIVLCPDCRDDLHFDCDDCRDHPLGTCANHYSATKYVDTNRNYQRKYDQFALTCDHCDDFHNHMVKVTLGKVHVAYCLTCYSEKTLKNHLRFTVENLQYLITSQAAARIAAEYLEAHASLMQELTGESFSAALGGPQEFYLEQARAAGNYPHGLSPNVSDDNFASHVQRELDHRTDMISTFRNRINGSMKDVKEAADKMILASDDQDVLASLKVPVLHGFYGGVIDAEKSLDTYADYRNYIFELYMVAEAAEIAVSDDVEDLGVIAHGNELRADYDRNSTADRLPEVAAIASETGQSEMYTAELERFSLQQIQEQITDDYFDRAKMQIRTSYERRAEPLDLRLNVLRDQQVADTCGTCDLGSTSCDLCPVATARLIGATMTLENDPNPYEAAARCITRGDATILHSWGRDHSQSHCDYCRVLADQEHEEMERIITGSDAAETVDMTVTPCAMCDSRYHSGSSHYCRSCNGYCPSGTGPDNHCLDCERRRAGLPLQAHHTPLLDRAKAGAVVAAISDQWAAASSYVPVRDRERAPENAGPEFIWELTESPTAQFIWDHGPNIEYADTGANSQTVTVDQTGPADDLSWLDDIIEEHELNTSEAS